MAETFHGHDVAPGLVYQDANVKVTAVENTHFHFPQGSPPYGKYKSYSYRFETPRRVVVFTGDGPEAFCSGGDQRVRGDDGYRDDKGIGRLNVLDLQIQIRRLPKPVVALSSI